jgi:predicted phage tail protein
MRERPRRQEIMKVTKTVGIILIVLGAAVVLGSVFADLLFGNVLRFGLKQLAGVVVGAADVVLGLILLLSRKSS